MRDDITPAEMQRGRLTKRVLSGFALALTIALSAYLLLNATRAGAGLGSLWFMALLPATLCALICYIGDPDQTRTANFYFVVPVVLVLLVDAGSVVFLHEGAICLIMVSPIWAFAGWAGAFLMRGTRGRLSDGRRTRDLENTFQSSFLIIPLVAGVIEAQIPAPHEQVTLSRSQLVRATPSEIWPYAVASHSIGPREGRWNITQNVIGVPRPATSL